MPPNANFRILIIGAYGLFGSRIAGALAGDHDLHLLLAGRDQGRARDLIDQLAARITMPRAGMEAIGLDVASQDLHARLAALRPDLIIDTAGPFQKRDYRVAEAALAVGAHYIDLADGRAFVNGIQQLDPQAHAADRRVISGASSVPGLHAAVIEAFRTRFASLNVVETAICPGNRTPRGWATTLAILGYVGKTFRVLIDGEWRAAHGWQSLRRLQVDGAGVRWAVRCEVPDLDLLPRRYPQLRTLDFRAGLELRRMHFGLWLASWAVRIGAIDTMARFAKPLYRLSQHWQDIGSDTGFIRVTLRGQDHDGAQQRLDWTLIARNGDGPQIPATASVILARKLARGALPGSGAKPCLDLFTLDEFLHALEGYAVEATLEASIASPVSNQPR